ncbi:MAG: 50S ribosomal protein L17 [Planctomycetota bacterium]
MRHRHGMSKLERKTGARWALLRGLASALVRHGRIETTLAKAKGVRPYAEKVITFGKRGGLANFRRCIALLGDEEAARKLVKEIVPLVAKRNGGYTRILKLADRRISDRGQKAILELVDVKPKTATPEGSKGKGKVKEKAAAK